MSFLKLFVFLGSKFQLVAVLQILIQNVPIVQSAIEKLLSWIIVVFHKHA